MDKDISTRDQENLKPEDSYFDFQSFWGITKHMGGLSTTEELAELCQIGADSHVLVVGCGAGISACHIARKYGSRIVAVDLLIRMVDWSRRRAHKQTLADRVEFSVADAQTLPFKEGTFDAVLCESVNAFVPDKQIAAKEYWRILKPGGYVGLNESIWLEPPPHELVDYVKRAMNDPEFLPPDGWQRLLEEAGFSGVTNAPRQVKALEQWRSEISGYQSDDYLDLFRAGGKFFSLAFRSASFRKYIRGLLPPRNIASIFHYMGYGLYTGRKPVPDL